MKKNSTQIIMVSGKLKAKEKIQAHFLKKSNLENVQKLKGLSQFLHFNSIELQAQLLMYIIAFSPTLT